MAIHWTDAWPEIAERIAAPPRLLVACDFDGTLVPLVSNPDAVALPLAALDALRRLSAAAGVSVAVVSGRSLADIVRRIPLEGIVVAGNHGLEIRGLGLDGERHQSASLKPRLHALALQLESALHRVPGIRIENKGLSVTVHYRNVPGADREHVIREVRHFRELDPAFKIQEGHMVQELIPDISWDKGAAVRQIIGRLGLPGSAVFYAGDDTTDESVFRTFPTGLTVSVGSERASAARWMARNPDDVCRLLERMADARARGRG